MADVTTNCIIRSITLQAGESFTLPANATLIGTDNVNNFESTCDLPTLETMECFGVVLAAYDNGGDSEYFEHNNQYIQGFELNGVYTSFGGDIQNSGANGSFNMNDLLLNLQAKLPAIIDGAVGQAGDSNNGQRSYLVIKTIPSIGNKLVLRIVTSAPAGSGQFNVTYKSAFYPYADLDALGYESFPECPTGA